MTTLDQPAAATTGARPRPWHDTSLPPAARAEALLAEMTLEEKVAQLGSRWVGNSHGGDHEGEGAVAPAEVTGTGNVAPLQDVFSAGAVDFEEASRHGLGHLTRVFGSRPVSVEEGRAEVVRLQRSIVERTRLGIPAIVHEECLTGFTAFGATVYPAALAWAATFDPELVERMSAAIGADMRAVGVHQGLSPVLDVVRDYRWGRVEETMGEDPHLVSTLGAAYVRGLESADVVATLKHFAGYSASRAARNHGPVSMGPREFADVVLPPFEAALRHGGARSVMNSYSDVDGSPAASDEHLFTDLLRERWGFTGTVVSDYSAIAFLASMHRTAADETDAGVQALRAGIDVELPDTLCFGDRLVAAVREGVVEEAYVDRALRRLLTQKAELGLLDAGWTPEGSVAAGEGRDLDSAGNRAVARELAERSVVLLANDATLPLAPAGSRRVAVVGPCADDPNTFMGCYAFPNHVLPRFPELGLGVQVPSLLDALRAEPGTGWEVVHERGCDVREPDASGVPAAVEAARGADVVVAVVGDRAGMFGAGTSGEGCDADDLRLPGVQEDLVRELIATGTPVVLVVVSGRPYALGGLTGAAALVQSFMPGEEGGSAIAGVLSGRVNPSGKLPVQVPATHGGQPGTYLQPPLGADSQGISNLDPTPLFPFGHGLSYTSFAVGDLELSSTEVPTDGSVEVSVTVRNTGERDGEEVVQLYLHDVLAQVTRPVRELTGFTRVRLEAGASARVTFELHADRTSFTGRRGERVVEPGEVEVMVGSSSTDTPCTGSFTLTGPLRTVGFDRVTTTPVRVDAVG
ncbi:glycoside hydrolase family 3 N-terminal domain-containing protein [Kineococcus sp. SYSU DK018]|uniref:glycoside hydrolase family 3 N-terminal domain-containing protein n=1 Tax=Kineococcus sp. SYSU DK018 TaxID=3383139 RepID=UPI003D7D99D7